MEIVPGKGVGDLQFGLTEQELIRAIGPPDKSYQTESEVLSQNEGASVAVNWQIWTRKCHRWGAILVALPFLLIIATGILLHLEKEWSWMQPPTSRGQGKTPKISLEAILEATRSRPEAGVQGWKDVDRLDIQPDRGIAEVRAHSRWVVHVDLESGEVLQVAYRRSDVIKSLHDGSWFHDRVKFWVFLPVAIVVLGLWVTGMYLFFLPYVVRWSRLTSKSKTR